MRSVAMLWFLLWPAVLFAQPVHSGRPPFAVWLEGVRGEARAAGISERTLSDALTGVEELPRVLELDRRQPESAIGFAQYVKNAVSPQRVREGRELYREHRALLQKIGQQYGVQPQFIVALWGIETSYGDNTGNFRVVDALATLAYDGRRSAYFRDELMKALAIIEQGHIRADAMQGSWAGAMGQCQFMPSSFLAFAVDADGDGKRDIWQTQEDVFASIAHYLSASGWQADQGWGRRLKAAEQVPAGKKPYVYVVGEEKGAPRYLVTDNYKVLLKWNRSRYFATAVGMLADRIAASQ